MSANAAPQTGRFSPVTLLVLGVCWVTIIFDGYDVVVYGAVVPALLEHREWALTPAEVGVIGSYALLGMFVGSLVVGTITDILGRRKTLIGCVVWFSIAMGLCAIAPSSELFSLFRFIAGLGLGGLLPTATALTTEYSPQRSRNFIYALMFTGFPLGGILAAFLGILLIPTFGFRIMFFIGMLPLLVVVPLAVKYLPESMAFLMAAGRRTEAEAIANRYGIPLESEPVRSAPEAERAAAPRRLGALANLFSRGFLAATLLFWVATFLCLFMIYGLNTWLPQIMLEAGYPLGSALAFLLVFNVGAIIGTVLIATAADRFGSKPVTIATFVLAAVSVALLSVQLPTLALYALVALGGVGVIATQTFVNAYVSKHYPVRTSATALGWSLGIGRLGSVAAPPVLGILVGSGLGVGWNFYAIAIPGLIGAVIIALVPKSPAESTQRPTAEAASTARATPTA